MMPWSYVTITIPQVDETTHGVAGMGWGKKGKEERDNKTRHETYRRDETQKWKEQMEGVMEGTHQSTWSR